MKVQIIDKKDLKSLTSIQVVKRDGTVTSFYPYKINLVLNALNADEQTSQSVYITLLDALLNQTTVTTKKIADLFVQGLVNANHEELAKVYRDYRQHDEEAFAEATNPQNKLEQLFDRNSRIVHENANKDSHVFNTQRDLEAGVVSRALGLRMLPGIVAKAHLRGDIHWHDLDYSPVTPETNCCLIDFDEMFKHGFKIGNAWVSSPRSIQTATAQM